MIQKGKVENVKQEMKRMKVNIPGLSEMRWKGAGCITSDSSKIPVLKRRTSVQMS